MSLRLSLLPVLLSGMVLLSGAAAAADAEEPPKQEPPGPEAALPGPDGDQLEPEVTIKQRGADTVHEYRMNGVLYMVKIVPQFGPPYYLVDMDGDGFVESRFNDPRQFNVPQWILFRW